MSSIRWSDVLLGMLITAAVANVVEFPAIESRASVNWKALHRWESSDVLEVNAVHRDYGFYVTFADIAPQASLIIAPKKYWSIPYRSHFRQNMFGIGRIAEMRTAQYHPRRDAPVGISGDTVAEGRFGKDGATYTIIASNQGRNDFVLFTLDEKSLLVVDLALLPHEQTKALRQ